VPTAGLETLGFWAGLACGAWLGLETPVLGLVTLLALWAGAGLLELGLVTLLAVVMPVWVLRGVVGAWRAVLLEDGVLGAWGLGLGKTREYL
jgi:hypothetical protein